MIKLRGKFSLLNGQSSAAKVKYFFPKNKVISFNEILKIDFLMVILL